MTIPVLYLPGELAVQPPSWKKSSAESSELGCRRLGAGGPGVFAETCKALLCSLPASATNPLSRRPQKKGGFCAPQLSAPSPSLSCSPGGGQWRGQEVTGGETLSGMRAQKCGGGRSFSCPSGVRMGEGLAVEQLLGRHSRSRDEHMPLSNNWPGSHPIDGGRIRHLPDPEPAAETPRPFAGGCASGRGGGAAGGPN